jgi:peptidoglycan hydrolase-like protein with peptidoglycan-binding domain
MRRGRFVLGGVILVVLAVAAAGAIVFASAKASLTSDGQAIAKIGMPLGGGSIRSVSVVTGPHATPIPVTITNGRVYPRHRIAADEKISVRVVVKRPGWISWAAGKTQVLNLSLTTPATSLRSHYITVRAKAPLRLHFKTPIEVFSYGSAGHLVRHVLSKARTTVTLPRTGPAGTTFVSAAPRRWENPSPAGVSWFPAGTGSSSAVADPAPGSQIKPGTAITVNFSEPVSKALGSHRPVITPATPGHWRNLTSHAIQFVPSGYGYGLGAKVGIAMPSGVRLVGGSASSSSDNGSWTVPAGSTVRLQQLLSLTGYLPLKFSYAGGKGVGLTPAEQENAAVDPPKGTFSWQYANTPSALKSYWQVGASGVMMQGALMAFENAHDMTADGVAGAAVWKALISDVLAGKRSTFGYTFVSVSEGSPETIDVWHNGKNPISGAAVNTGGASTPTATGTFPVFEHLPVTTMSGTNPDGSHYSDPGIQDVSYFNGGDALHAFTRAQYGFPQSDGCVEMPLATAAQVYPYTPIGTLVHVT